MSDKKNFDSLAGKKERRKLLKSLAEPRKIAPNEYEILKPYAEKGIAEFFVCLGEVKAVLTAKGRSIVGL